MKDLINMKPINLESMEAVKLMNRIDLKYWVNAKHLPYILESVKDDYYVLNINGESKLAYETTYYDTIGNEMYISHHNGKLSRYKIRRRTYVSSELSFLEVKFKSNKGRTIKTRIISNPSDLRSFNTNEQEFIGENTPYKSDDLHIALKNKFQRITLVSKGLDERCTIDLNLHFDSAGEQVSLSQIVVIEIKSSGKAANSSLALNLRNLHIKKKGFSKYCIGRSYTDNGLKINNFKLKLRTIEKQINAI
jgi:hypothetical protein